MGVPAESVAEAYDAFERGEVTSPLTAAAISNQTIQESMRLLLMVRAFQVMGHYAGERGEGREEARACAWMRGCVVARRGREVGMLPGCECSAEARRPPPMRCAYPPPAPRPQLASSPTLTPLRRAAQLDPLGIDERPRVKELDPAYYGFTEKDLNRE